MRRNPARRQTKKLYDAWTRATVPSAIIESVVPSWISNVVCLHPEDMKFLARYTKANKDKDELFFLT